MCSCQGAEQANEIATISGGNDGEVPPVPIPNTAVKLTYAESTWLETAREDRELPVYNKNPVLTFVSMQGLFVFIENTNNSVCLKYIGSCLTERGM